MIIEHRIRGRRNTPPTQRQDRRVFLVGGNPDSGSAFEGHAHEFAFDFPGGWAFRAPIRGERVVFVRNGQDERREWSGKRWHRPHEPVALEDLDAGATRAQLVAAHNTLLAALRDAGVLDASEPD